MNWIKVSDRLPEGTDNVLAYDGDEYFVAWLTAKHTWGNGEQRHWVVEFQDELTITHWMPLPEPPKDINPN